MRPGFVGRIGVGAAGAPTFNPETDVSSGTLKAWWDASVLTDADGTALATWPNRCADGLWPLSQSSGAKPLVKTNILNGLRVVRCSGSLWMVTTTIASPGRITGTTMTAFEVVIRRGYVSGAPLSSLVKASDGADWTSVNGGALFHETSTSVQEHYQGSSPRASCASHPGNDVPMMLTTWWDGTNNHMTRRASGSTVTATPVAYAPTFNVEFAQLAKRWGSSAIGNYDHAEKLYYQGSLSSGDRAAVQAYLQAKWGIA